MPNFRYCRGFVAFAVLFLIVAPAQADLAASLPADSVWYFHTDLEEMRSSESGRDLHAWLDREVFDDIRDEIGIDFATEVDRITAFSAAEDNIVLVIDGNVEETSRDKLIALASLADEFDSFTHKGRAYYFVRGEAELEDGDMHIDTDDGAYFSFDVRGKVLIASTEEQMQELLDNKGRIAGGRSHNGALFVLTAERNLVQAGVNADGLAERSDNDHWDSNFLKNARQVAFLLADAGGKLALEAQMIAVDAEKAAALASIARGLVALQAFSEEIDPELRELLQNTSIDVANETLKLKMAIDPALVVATLDD